jgi:hypothetical protein
VLSDRRPAPASGRVQAFIDSQRGLAPFYASEGKNTATTWINTSTGDSRSRSPMLIPRTAAAMHDGLGAAAPNDPSDKYETPLRPSPHSTAPLRNPKRISHSKIAPPALINSRKSGATQLKPVDRDPNPDDESERSQSRFPTSCNTARSLYYLAGLAQRRDRRRARRAATRAADDDSISEAASSQEDAGHKNKRQKIGSKSKSKSKSMKVTPALLLMQTFSGRNMGKSRLTVRRRSVISVWIFMHYLPDETKRDCWGVQ